MLDAMLIPLLLYRGAAAHHGSVPTGFPFCTTRLRDRLKFGLGWNEIKISRGQGVTAHAAGTQAGNPLVREQGISVGWLRVSCY